MVTYVRLSFLETLAPLHLLYLPPVSPILNILLLPPTPLQHFRFCLDFVAVAQFVVLERQLKARPWCLLFRG